MTRSATPTPPFARDIAIRVVRPIVIKEPCDGYTESMRETNQNVRTGGLGGQFQPVHRLALDAGPAGESELGEPAPLSQASGAAADGGALSEDIRVVQRGWQHPFTLV